MIFRKKKSAKFHAVVKKGNPRKKRVSFIRRVIFSKVSLILVLLLIISSALFYYLFISEEFTLSEVAIDGVGEELRREIEENFLNIASSSKFFILQQDTSFSFPKKEFEENLLKNIPKLASVEVKIEQPHKITVEAEERKQRGIWCYEENCYFYDKEGVVYENAPNSIRGSLIVVLRDLRPQEVYLGQEVIDSEFLVYVEDLIEALQHVYEKPNYIEIRSNVEVEAGFNEGWEAYFSREESLEESVENLVLILNKEVKNRSRELEYVDLRLGNKAFYKYKGI